jgi:hypothetical protein
MKNLHIDTFKSLLLLLEQEEKPKGAPESDLYLNKENSYKARQSLHSVDDQIDALILRYESLSIRSKDDSTLMESLAYKNLKFLLEQDEEEEFEEEEEEFEEESPEGSEVSTTKKPAASVKLPNLDIDQFTLKCLRLILNYKTLLSIEGAVINRIKNFLDENYGDEYVTRFLDTLSSEHGIDLSEFDIQKVEKVNNDKFAVGANPAGVGMSGGG